MKNNTLQKFFNDACYDEKGIFLGTMELWDKKYIKTVEDIASWYDITYGDEALKMFQSHSEDGLEYIFDIIKDNGNFDVLKQKVQEILSQDIKQANNNHEQIEKDITDLN